MTYPEKRNCRKLCFLVLLEFSYNGFRKKDAVKNACDGVATVLEFIKTGNYFYFNSFMSLFETVLFIWLSPLGPGVHNLYPQYNLIYPWYHPSICPSLWWSGHSKVFLKIHLKILNYSLKKTCVWVYFCQTWRSFPTQVFFCEYCKVYLLLVPTSDYVLWY